jgi:hypothetical protein
MGVACEGRENCCSFLMRGRMGGLVGGLTGGLGDDVRVCIRGFYESLTA